MNEYKIIKETEKYITILIEKNNKTVTVPKDVNNALYQKIISEIE